MRLLTWSVIVVCVASALNAAPVLVTSGEHEDFSRLVFNFSRPFDWSLEEAETGYALNIDRSAVEYDTSRVFQFIPKTRLRSLSVEPGGGRIEFEINCDCHAVAFDLPRGQVVVDFRDGPSPEVIGAVEQIDLNSLPLPNWFETRSARTGLRVDDLTAPDTSLENLQEQLLIGFSAAAAEGVIDPVGVSVRESDQDTTGKGAGQNDEGQPDSEQNLPVTVLTQMQIDTAIRTALNDDDETCELGMELDVPSWGIEGDLLLGLATLRRDLVGSDLNIDADAVSRLARALIWLSFGAEAIQVLGLAPATTPKGLAEYEVMRALAEILDDGEIPETAFPVDNLHCSSPVSLWAFLATSGTVPLSDDARLETLHTFNALPAHLRLHLGPELHRRFLDIGAQNAAETVRQAMARATSTRPVRQRLVEAISLRDQGNDFAARSIFMELARGSDDVADQALRHAVSLFSETDKAPDWILTVIESRIFANRGSPKADQFRDALIGHLLWRKEFRRAESVVNTAPFATRTPAHRAYLEDVLRLAPDGYFAEFATRNREDILNDPEAEPARTLVVDRFVQLGLLQSAQEFGLNENASRLAQDTIRDQVLSPGLAESLPGSIELRQSEYGTVSLPNAREILQQSRDRRKIIVEAIEGTATPPD